MSWFGKSFEEKVQEAVETINGLNLGVMGLRAEVDGKVVTLDGEAPTRDIKARIITEFNKLVETDNTINRIRVTEPVRPAAPVKDSAAALAEAPAEVPPAADTPQEQVYVVAKGDTLSGIAKRFYGKGSLYPKIFEANRDVLDNPDLIKVGQKLRIPKI